LKANLALWQKLEFFGHFGHFGNIWQFFGGFWANLAVLANLGIFG